MSTISADRIAALQTALLSQQISLQMLSKTHQVAEQQAQAVQVLLKSAAETTNPSTQSESQNTVNVVA